MNDKKNLYKKHRRNMKGHFNNHASGGAVYGMGFIGAAVYFIGNANTFGMGVLGLLKAIVWPAILIFQAFDKLAK
jgi:hypothetical protein